MIRYGKHAVESALAYPDDIQSILVATQQQKNPHIQSLIVKARSFDISVEFLSHQDLTKRAQVSHHQGIVALVKDYPMVGFKTLLNQVQKYPIILALDHIQDPHNVGAIIRSAEAFGVTALLLPKDRSCPITPAVCRSSSGAIDHVDCIEVSNLANGLKQLKDAGFWVYGADSNQGKPISDTRFNRPMVLVVGNESKGIGHSVQKQCDETVLIPLNGQTSSLNVSVATGILLYHVSTVPDW